MLSYIRRFLYVVALIVVILYIWHGVIQRKNQQTFHSLQSDLFLSQVNLKPAPNLSLIDQHHKKQSLSNFKGEKIVLQFMDPKCTDVCPLISEEIIQANNKLGKQSKRVVYIAVNVNQYHNTVSDVASFSKEHGLSQLPNWYFLTGTSKELKKVWDAYHIDVVPSKDGDVQHTSAMYFINSKGNEVYLGEPETNAASIQKWSMAIKYLVNQMR